MTHEEFHSIVIKISNQVYVRHWNYFNYPEKPQKFGIKAFDFDADFFRLHKELTDLGFVLDDSGIWIIEKS